MTKEVNLIAAVAQNGIIGNNGTMPWHISEDFKLFKGYTTGSAIIMGRKTYESLGRPLPNRTNIVLSKQMKPQEGIIIAHDLEEAIKIAHSEKFMAFIIGGAQLYEQTLNENIIDFAFISHIKGSYEGDTFFPQKDFSKWKLLEQKEYQDFTFKKYNVNKRMDLY